MSSYPSFSSVKLAADIVGSDVGKFLEDPAGTNNDPGSGVFPDLVELKRSSQRPGLFDYQKELALACVEHMFSGVSGLISLPTGGGKTRTASFAVLDYFAVKPSGRILWLAPTTELLDQAQRTLSSMWAEFGSVGDVSIYRHLAFGSNASICLLTPQALFETRAALQLSGWDAVVFDEAHQIAAPKFLEAVESIRVHSPGISILGLSATPGRTDDDETKALISIFGRNLLTSPTLGEKPVEFLQRRGILSKLVFNPVQGDYGVKLGAVEMLRLVVEKAQTLSNQGKNVLIFANSVNESEAIAIALRAKGIPASHVDGTLEQPERTSRIFSFGMGRTKVLTNQKLLITGYDCPAVSDLIILPRVGSAIQFEQMVGRAARGPRTGGTSTSTIWQFVDHLALHGLPSSYYRYKEFGWNSKTP